MSSRRIAAKAPVRPVAMAAAALASSAMLAACGTGTGLIPATQAGALEKGFEEIATYAQEGRCTAAREAIETTQAGAEGLGSGVNAKLRATILRGIANLRKRALSECRERTTSSSTTTTTTHTLTSTTPVQITETTSSTTSQIRTAETSGSTSSEAGNGGTPLPSEGAAAEAEHPGAPAGEAPSRPGNAEGGPAKVGKP